MKQQLKYDPEDIESLMLAKSFDELLPEERTFVLRHIESEREYNSMRLMLLQSISTLQTDPPEPPSALREKVMDQYRTQFREKPRHHFWLNLYSAIWNPVGRRPYIALAVASVVIFFGVFLWVDPLQEGKLAIEQPVERPGKIEQQREAPATEAAASEEMKTIDEAPDFDPELITEPDQLNETTKMEANQAQNQTDTDIEQANDVAEEVEFMGQPRDERTTTSAAAAGNANPIMADSQPSEAEDTDRLLANGQEDDKSLINDALFAVLYTAR